MWNYRTGSPWRDLPDELGSLQTSHKRLLRWAVDGTWERILAALLAAADDADDIGWTVSADSTITARPPARYAEVPAADRPVRERLVAHENASVCSQSAGRASSRAPTASARRVGRSAAPALKRPPLRLAQRRVPMCCPSRARQPWGGRHPRDAEGAERRLPSARPRRAATVSKPTAPRHGPGAAPNPRRRPPSMARRWQAGTRGVAARGVPAVRGLPPEFGDHADEGGQSEIHTPDGSSADEPG